MALTSDQQPPRRTRRPKLVLGHAGVAGGVPPADVGDRQRPVGQQCDPEGGEANKKRTGVQKLSDSAEGEEKIEERTAESRK